MYLAKKCPTPTSRYASTYLPDITEGKHSSDYVAFTHALAEQIAESFVGYVIGIVPNDQGSIVFKEHSPEAWELMRELATARIIQS